jgi:hypothetical protein
VSDSVVWFVERSRINSKKSHNSSSAYAQTITDATQELNLLLENGTYQERLMRLYALTELVGLVSPELLLRFVANLGTYLPDADREAA